MRWWVKPKVVLCGVLGGVIFLGILLFPDTSGSAGTNSVSHTSICDIQGDWFTSPYENEAVQTHGVVFADLETSQKGFYMQSVNCDTDPDTSDGIFVYLGASLDTVQSGDLVEVSGVVQEYYGMTEIDASQGNIAIISSGNNLPVPVDINPPFDEQGASRYYESLEGMYVALNEAAVVGPTSSAGETWVVRADLGVKRVFQGDPEGTAEILCVDDGGLYEIAPEAKVGDRVLDLVGALDYSYGVYRLLLTEMPSLLAGEIPLVQPIDPEGTSYSVEGAFNLTVGTFNLANLFDTYDDPYTEDSVLSAAEYQRRIKKRALAIHNQLDEPVILALQEAENGVVLQDLVGSPEIESEYAILWQDGPDFRGIDIALLYRSDVVELLDYAHLQGCTDLLDGLGPDGNRDVINPQNAITCDSDANGFPDGNRLFSRPPLVATLRVCPSGCAAKTGGVSETFIINIIVNHWKSKLQDGFVTQYTLPRRVEQAQFVADEVRRIREEDARSSVIILGDLNDYPDSEPVSLLKDAGLLELSVHIPKEQRYTYIYQGVSQVLDYVFFIPSPGLKLAYHLPMHINTDYPSVYEGIDDNYYRCSDHDPLLTTFARLDHFSYLPYTSSQ